MPSAYCELRNLFVKELISQSKTMKYTLFFIQERRILGLRMSVLIFFLWFEAENVLEPFLSYMSLA